MCLDPCHKRLEYLLASFCCTAVWASGIGSVSQVLEVPVIGGHTRTQRAAWVSPDSRIVFGARVFIRVNH